MNSTIEKLLNNREDNHILPFFWQHGEDEQTLRHYVRVIRDANCRAFCVESRPHPDFCGEQWWRDMDAILDEAEKNGMQVWILDDSHFPTGYANGAMENAPAELCRQSICAVTDGNFPPVYTPSIAETYMVHLPQRTFDDDRVLARTRFGDTVWTVGLSRNVGYRRNYINMLSAESVGVLIDAVYEPHWAHYSRYFGNVIAGFFSDEPEFGNGHIYEFDVGPGKEYDLPFSDAVGKALEESLGPDWAEKMYLLWENRADPRETAAVRLAYMDAVTGTVRETFSYRLGNWCRDHGVMYIGHIIEDNGAHCHTGSSLGHYFRALEGQDMAGIDDIGGQVMPQQEDNHKGDRLGRERNSEFYHFMLARLASSAAAIEPRKQGRAMCEIFGAYGWGEGVHLEKYLADHFMVRGVNHFVPHAFSPKAFPDPDCPPHFYAHGHNPQYRHFGELMRYMNRVCTILSSGTRVARTALVYHGEAQWQGIPFTPNELMARKLEEAQISFDIVPQDYFDFPEKYVNRHYETVIPFTASELPDGLTPEVVFAPASRYLRVCRIRGESDICFFVNEAATVWQGSITLPLSGKPYAYNAWDNRLETVDLTHVTLEPGKSLILVFDQPDCPLEAPVVPGEEITLEPWSRSVCEAADYPRFGEEAAVTLPDRLAEEQPKFSGYVRYHSGFTGAGSFLFTVSDAEEGMEVFVDGRSLGIQIIPEYRYAFEVGEGHHELIAEVATTLLRKCYTPGGYFPTPEPTCGSGITGTARLCRAVCPCSE